MEGFDINAIKIVNGKEPKLSELLTGSVVKGLDPHSPIKPNAELEDEYLQYPDGVVVKAGGEKHSKGGIDMNIPDGTKVISNFLKLSAKQASELKKDFSIDVSTKDTYTTAMDKYLKKIGYKKLDEEQEEAFTQLKKVLDKTDDPNTRNINKDYISKKIYNIEKQKTAKDQDKRAFFDVVYDMQESSKPKKEQAKDEEKQFKYGGISMQNFEAICKKYGVTPAQAEKLLKGEPDVKRFAEGGEQNGEPQIKWGENDKGAAKIQYDYIKDKLITNPEFVAALYEEYQNTLKDENQFSGLYKTKGQYRKNIENLTPEEVAQNYLEMQERNLVFKSHGLDEEIKGSAQSEKKNQKIAELSKKFGLKPPTDGISNAKQQLSYVAFDKLAAKKKEQPEVLQNLLQPFEAVQFGKSDEKGSYKATISPIDGAYTNTTAGQVSLFNTDAIREMQKTQEPKKEAEVKTEPERETGKEGKLDDIVIPAMGARRSSRYFMPEPTILAPSGMEAHYKGKIDLQEIDPINVGIQRQVQENADQQKFVTQQLQEIPDAQKASALVSLLASSQKATNEAIHNVNVTNAERDSQAELFNIGQRGQESTYELNNALNFEQRQLTAKAKTEKALGDYVMARSNIAIDRFDKNRNLNLLASNFEDVDLDFMGNVVHRPNNKPVLMDNRNLYEIQGYMPQVESAT